MTKDEALKLALEALENNKQTHYYCEDPWYSCPQHEEGCANDFAGDECNCGADKANAEIEKAITAIKEALAQPEQEHAKGLAKLGWQYFECPACGSEGARAFPKPVQEPCQYAIDVAMPEHRCVGKCQYAAQRQWVGLTDEEIETIYAKCNVWNKFEYERMLEAKLKAKNGFPKTEKNT